MNKVFTSYISLLYSVQRNIEWSADFPLFGLVTTHADIDIWSDLNPKYLRIPLPDYVYLIFSSPLPPNSLFNQVDTRYEYESVHGKTFLIRGPVLCLSWPVKFCLQGYLSFLALSWGLCCMAPLATRGQVHSLLTSLWQPGQFRYVLGNKLMLGLDVLLVKSGYAHLISDSKDSVLNQKWRLQPGVA